MKKSDIGRGEAESNVTLLSHIKNDAGVLDLLWNLQKTKFIVLS